MKHIAELTVIKPISSDQTISIGDADKIFINHLFDQLSGIFPAWKQAFENEAGMRNAKRQWMTGLIDNGITTPEKIKKGLQIARQSESPFLPSVGKFIAWCKDVNKIEYHEKPMLKNPRTPETANREIKKIKSNLGMK